MARSRSVARTTPGGAQGPRLVPHARQQHDGRGFYRFREEIEAPRCRLQGGDAREGLEPFLGYSHPVIMKLPEGITVKCPSNTEVVVSGYDKVEVGNFAAIIRSKRPPEPYKGKGIRYEAK